MAGKKMGVCADQHSDEHGVQRLFNVLIMYKNFAAPDSTTWEQRWRGVHFQPE